MKAYSEVEVMALREKIRTHFDRFREKVFIRLRVKLW